MTTRMRKPRAERRREIAEAALRIVGLRGATELTTAALAEEMGLSSGALFRHFAALDDVLREAVRQALERMERTFPDPSLPPVERLLALAANRVKVLSSDPGAAWVVRSEQALQMLPEDSVSSLRALVSRSQRFLLDAIRQGAREGSIRNDIEPETLLLIVSGTIHTLVGMPGLHQRATSDRRSEHVLDGLRRMLAPPGRRGSRSSKRTGKEKKK